MKPPALVAVLPAAAAKLLQQAVIDHPPGSLARLAAIEKATETAKRKHPQFFQQGAKHESQT